MFIVCSTVRFNKMHIFLYKKLVNKTEVGQSAGI